MSCCARPGCSPTSYTPRVQRRAINTADARARRGRPALDPGAPVVAAQRAPLRRAPGQEQEGDPRGVRRGAVHALAPLVRRTAAADRRRQRVLPERAAAVRRPRRRDAPHRVPQGRHRPVPAVLGVLDRPRPAGRPDRPHRGARQQPARAGEAPRRHQRRRHRRAQHPDRHAPGLRARRPARADRRRRHATSTPRRQRPQPPPSPTRAAERYPRRSGCSRARGTTPSSVGMPPNVRRPTARGCSPVTTKTTRLATETAWSAIRS